MEGGGGLAKYPLLLYKPYLVKGGIGVKNVQKTVHMVKNAPGMA